MSNDSLAKHSLDRAIGQAALKVLTNMKPGDFVESLKRQGITSLDDLATKSLEIARNAMQAGNLAVDAEVFGHCYKWTTYRPHFGDNTINQVINIVSQEFQKR